LRPTSGRGPSLDLSHLFMPVPTKTVKQHSASRKPQKKTADSREWRLRKTRGLQILEAPELSRLDWLVHGFSTRGGGASKPKIRGDGKSQDNVLNLGFTDGDVRDRVLANRKRFFGAIGSPKTRTVLLRQIHSDLVYVVGAGDVGQGDDAPQGDALVTREPRTILAVQTADCIPILFADTKQRAIAAIHSGWRGTAQRIAEKTLGRMRMEFGTRPEDIVAAIGPGIGACCYEVGHQVTREFAAQFPNARDWFDGPFDLLENGDGDSNWLPWLTMRPPGHRPPAPTARLDLLAANRAILAGAGIPPARISTSDLCTACRPDLFFSYRRERNTGRMMAAIGIK
jgi:YfiH family protein